MNWVEVLAPSKNSDNIIALLRMYDLVTMNTMFQPKKHASVHTFLQTKRSDNDDKYVGRVVKVKYKGAWVEGKVIEPSLIAPEPAWIDELMNPVRSYM